jgi:hypothetical protein
MRKNKLVVLVEAQGEEMMALGETVLATNILAYRRGRTINHLQRRLRKMNRKYAALHHAMKPHRDAAWRQKQLDDALVLEATVDEAMDRATFLAAYMGLERAQAEPGRLFIMETDAIHLSGHTNGCAPHDAG